VGRDRRARRSRTRHPLKNFPLHRLHPFHPNLVTIIKTVQMQQTVHKVQANLPRERVPKPARLFARQLGTDKNFAVLKGQNVRRPALAEELSM